MVLDLLNGASTVSSSLVYNGFFNTLNTSFPTLLTGNSTSRFWPLPQSVMLMAPALSFGHDSGLLLFPATVNESVSVSAVGAVSPALSGDGLEAYLMVTPTSTANWNSAFFATDPEGPNGTFGGCSGSMIFPYSTTPYVAVQWDPGYAVSRCASSTGQFNLYLVTPEASGVVTKSNITFVGEVGTSSGLNPKPDDFLFLNTTYYVGNDSLSAEVLDENNTVVNYSLSVNLGLYGFTPTYAVPGSSYAGAGGSGNYPAGWGLLYLATTSGSAPSTPPPQAPTIASVTMAGGAGNWSLAVNGYGFGPSPVAMPFTGTTAYFRIGDNAQLGHGEWGYGGDANPLRYDSWTNTRIVVSGFGGDPGDAIQLALWNPSTGAGAAWGGNVTATRGTPEPQIDRVVFSGSGGALQITVEGTGFGPAPNVTFPYTGDLRDFWFTDWRNHCSGGSSDFEAGFSPWGVGPDDSVTLTYDSWTTHEIRVSGLAGSYGSGCAVAAAGDPVTVSVWNTSDSSVTGLQSAWGGVLVGSGHPAVSNLTALISPSLYWTGEPTTSGPWLLVPGGNGLVGVRSTNVSAGVLLNGSAQGYWDYAAAYWGTTLLGGTGYNCPGGVRLDEFNATNATLTSVAGLLPPYWRESGACHDLKALAVGGTYVLLVEETNGSRSPQVGLIENNSLFDNVTGAFPFLPRGWYYVAYGSGEFLVASAGASFLYTPGRAGGNVRNVTSQLSGVFSDPPWLGPAPTLVAWSGSEFVVGYDHEVVGFDPANLTTVPLLNVSTGSVSFVGFVPAGMAGVDLWVGVTSDDFTTVYAFHGLVEPTPIAAFRGTATGLAAFDQGVWVTGTDFDQPHAPACGCEPTLDEVVPSTATYPVTFSESGLPLGTTWSVNVSGVGTFSNVAGSDFNESVAELANGSYAFAVNTTNSSWQVVNQSGSFVVAGEPVDLSVLFVPARPVLVNETGLAPDTAWTLFVNGSTAVNVSAVPFLFHRTTVPVHYVFSLFSRTTGPRIPLPVGNYTASYFSTYGHALAASQPLEVPASGPPPQVRAPFAHVAYPVTFVESGLTTGTAWGVTSTGSNATAPTTAVTLYLTNGTYPITITAPPGYRISGPTAVSVSGREETKSVRFTARPAPDQPVRFVESGLPKGTDWTVSLGGVTVSSRKTVVEFTEPVGTFPYSVIPLAGFRTPAAGSVTVDARGVTVHLRFLVSLYAVTFNETGLPPHTAWKIIVGSRAVRTTTSSPTLDLKNGTYDFRISGPRSYTTASLRQVLVNGTGIVVDVVFARDPPGSGGTGPGAPPGGDVPRIVLSLWTHVVGDASAVLGEVPAVAGAGAAAQGVGTRWELGLLPAFSRRT